MAKGLTAKQVENIRPRATRVELPDAGCRGLYLVVQPSGARSWAVRYRYGGKPRKLTLEPEAGAPPLTLAAARRLAADALLRLEKGTDPAEAKRHGSRRPTTPPLPARPTPSRRWRRSSSSVTAS